MILSIDEQARIFMYVFAAGIAAGLFYDIIELLRNCIKHSKAAVCAEDILYWTVVIVLLFLFMLKKNSAEIRFFNIIGFFAGMLFHNLLLEKPVIKIMTVLVNVIRMLIRLLFEVVMTPFRLVWLIIGEPVKYLYNLGGGYFKKVLHLSRVYAKIRKRRFADQMRFIRHRKE